MMSKIKDIDIILSDNEKSLFNRLLFFSDKLGAYFDIDITNLTRGRYDNDLYLLIRVYNSTCQLACIYNNLYTQVYFLKGLYIGINEK